MALQNTSLLHADAAGLVECIWGEGVVGKGLCNAADMVAEHGPAPAAGSIPAGGEQVTLQKIWEKLCCLDEEVRGNAFHEEVRAGGEVSEARQKIKKLEKREEKDEKEDPWKAASEDLAGAIATGPQINLLEDELLNGLLKRALGLQRWLAKLCFAM